MNAKLTMNKGEEAIDVCAAIQELEARAASKAASQAASQAADKERLMTWLGAVKKLVKNSGWSVEQSMDMLEIPENIRSQLFEMLD